MTQLRRLTNEEKERWLETGWDHCPYCGSPQLEGGPYEGDANYVLMVTTCLDCRRQWQEGYVLSWMDEIVDDPDADVQRNHKQ